MGKKNQKITHEEYLERLNEYPLQVLPIEKYIDRKTKITHKCIKCGSIRDISPKSVYQYLENNITICQQCGGRKLVVGKNDLWTTHPDVAKMLSNPSEGYSVSKGSKKKLDWVCPICGTIVREKMVLNVVRVGLCCPICSRGRSMGHRVINAILEICNIDYKNEVEFSWSQKKRYDIYTSDNCIIEINGQQHYEDCYLLRVSNKTLKDEQENDLLKYTIAKENDIENYIVINAKESNYAYIIEQIKQNTEFIKYINNNSDIKFNNIPWEKVFEKYNDTIAWSVLRGYKQGKMIKDIALENKVDVNTITRHLKLLSEYGYCDYNPADQIKHKVRCITTGEEFDSMQEAGEKYGIKPLGIYRVCKGLFNRETAGKLPDGTRLKWEYIDKRQFWKQEGGVELAK